MNVRLFFCLFLSGYYYILSFSSAYASEPLELDIDAAIERAMQANLGIQATDRATDGQSAALQAARSARLPRLQWQSSAIRSNAPMAVFGSKLSQQRIGPADFLPSTLNSPPSRSWYQHRLVMDLPLYQGGATGAAIAQGEARLIAQRHNAAYTRERIVYAVYAAYSEALRARSSRKVAMQARKAAKTHLARARHMLRRGMLLQSDVMDAEVHLLNTQVSLRQVENRYQQALDRLRRLLALEIDRPLRLRDWPGLDETLLAHDEAWWREQAEAHRQDLAALRAEVDEARASAERIRASFRPALGLQAAQEWNNDTPAPKHGNTTIALNLQWNLFAGGSDQARLRAAEAQLAAKELTVGDLRQQIQIDIRSALRQRDEAQARWQARQRAEAQARESLRIHRLRFEQGMEDINSMLDAQTRLDAAAQAVIEARFDHRLANLRLLLAAGLMQTSRHTKQENHG